MDITIKIGVTKRSSEAAETSLVVEELRDQIDAIELSIDDAVYEVVGTEILDITE